MRVGFTGTRKGMTDAQSLTLKELLIRFHSDIFESTFLHGGCIGADEQAANLAYNLDYYVKEYPCDLPSFRTRFVSHESRLPEQPLKRNRWIVRDSDIMIATPKEDIRPNSTRGSGTWFTIDHCHKQNINRRCIIIWPNGQTLGGY